MANFSKENIIMDKEKETEGLFSIMEISMREK